MTDNPLFDLFNLFNGNAGDYNRFGSVKYVSVIFCLCLLAGGFYIAFLKWSRDAEQCTSYRVIADAGGRTAAFLLAPG